MPHVGNTTAVALVLSFSASGQAATEVLTAALVQAVAADGGKMPTRADSITFDQNGDLLGPVLTVRNGQRWQSRDGGCALAKTQVSHH